MNSAKPWQSVFLLLAGIVAAWAIFSHLQYLSDVSVLGGILLIEVIIVSLWKYAQRFFILLMIAFLWSGMNVPAQSVWTSARWAVLASGALVGAMWWLKGSQSGFRVFHLLALFCACAAFVSATISPFPQMAAFKALSLFLLFLYCSSGARLAVIGREESFFRGLLVGCEIVVYGTAVCYLALGLSVWGNPNSLGAAMSIGIFPVLLWGWLASDASGLKLRRLIALLVCAYLITFSMARAGMISMVLVTLVLFLCLRQYRPLVKASAIALLILAIGGVLAPDRLERSLGNMKDAALYKGHKEEGVLGSRQSPWQTTITTIKEHPWFGTGYGTSPTGNDPGLSFGKFASSAETVREHGSSYMTITEWVGLLGVLPFLALLILVVANIWRVCAWMRRTRNPRHYSIPLAMVLLAGLVHAGFEDWLFAVGAYPCVYFWFFAFVLADLLPVAVVVPFARVYARTTAPVAGLRAAVPNR
jgi:O-antigen ligase